MEFWSAFSIAFDLITTFDADLVEVVLLSLRVSFSALCISALVGLPFGGLLATSDFFGNPVDLSAGTPNIGACNAKAGGSGISDDRRSDLTHMGCVIYPNPVNDEMVLELHRSMAGSLDIHILDTVGRTVQIMTDVRASDKQTFSLEIDPVIGDGIYYVIAGSGAEKVSSRFILERD